MEHKMNFGFLLAHRTPAANVYPYTQVVLIWIKNSTTILIKKLGSGLNLYFLMNLSVSYL